MSDFEQLFAQLPTGTKANIVEAIRFFIQFKEEYVRCNK